MCWLRRIGIALLGLALVSSARASVVNYWRFEDNSSTFLADETGLANGVFLSGEIPNGGDIRSEGWSTNVPSSTVPGTGEANLGSVHFGGGDIRLSPTAPMNYGSNFTLEFFFNLDSIPTVNSPYFFLRFSDDNTGIRLSLWQQVGGGIHFQVLADDDTPTGSAFYFSPNVSLSAQVWNHFAWVKAGGDYQLYLNGFLIDQRMLGAGADGAFTFAADGHYFIGTDNFSGGFDGYLDEIRISNVALAPSQFLNVPEPSTFTLVVGALASFAALRKRRAQCARPTP